MYLCRLFHRDRPTEQIDARLIAGGTLTIGRDPGIDWPLDDPEGLLSRIHCTLVVEEGRLVLIDGSTNGTFVDGTRAPRGAPVPLEAQQTIRLGAFSLLMDLPQETANLDATLIALPPALPDAAWERTTEEAKPRHADASLLEAFCEGARLDASTFSDEDPEVLMRRLGGIYQQTVLGLAALMKQRTAMKQAHDLDRTTVSAEGNNPVKWTAPRRLAQDLLRARLGGFLAGEEAVRASFLELAEHLEAIAAAANAAIEATLGALEPDALAAAVPAQGFSLRGKPAAQLDLLRERHRMLRDGGAVRTFAEGYRRAGDAPSLVVRAA